MKCYLLVDFGSTYTKLTIVDIENENIVATACAITTIEDDIMNGFNEAYAKIEPIILKNSIEFVEKLGCSSAAGGLKMIAVGLVPELTSEAAKRAALGAGAKILNSYSYELSDKDVEEMIDLKPEIILFSGGTDGGNKETILKNARRLAKYQVKTPIIIACNRNTHEEIEEIFTQANMNFYLSENVMPKINSLNVEPVRNIVREVFMENIVHAKGLDKAIEYIGDILMPTPAAVLNAAYFLSQGTETEDGLSDLIVLDVGGATTDIHSLSDGYPSKGGITLKGLEEPFSKRSVEGDLGMRYSASACYETAGYRKFKQYLPFELSKSEVEMEIKRRHDNIKMVPSNETDFAFDQAIASVCCDLAMTRHAGFVETSFSPFGNMIVQYGKDLTQVRYLTGTGGVLIHGKDPKAILQAAMFDSSMPESLRPMKAKFLLDESYILSAMGLLATKLPDHAIRIMKKYIKEIVED